MKESFLKRLYKRPLSFSAALYLILLFIFTFYNIKNKTAGIIVSAVFCVCFALFGAVFFILFKKSKSRASQKHNAEHKLRSLFTFLALLSLSVLLAFSSSFLSLDSTYTRITEKYAPESFDAEFLITDKKVYSDSFTVYTAKLLSKNDTRVKENINILLSEFSPSGLDENDVAKAKLALSVIPLGNSLGDFTSFSDGIFLEGALNSPTLLYTDKNTLRDCMFSLRSYISDTFDLNLSDKASPIAKALVLGDRSEIPTGTKNGFTTLGISHILAVSGLHLSIIVAIFGFICGFLGLNKYVRISLIIIFASAFACITGFPPSVLRALGMLTVFTLSSLLGRKSDTVTSLLFSVAVIVLISPSGILDLSLLLSFTSTLGILTVSAPITKSLSERFQLQKRKTANFFISSAVMTFGAVTASLPIICISFSQISFLSVFANLLFIPLTTLTLILFIILLSVSFIPFVSAGIGGIASLVCLPIFSICDYFGGKAFFLTDINYPFTLPFAAFFVIATAVSLNIFKKRKYRVFIPCAVILASFLICVGIYTLNVDKTVSIECTDGNTVLLRDGRICAVIDLSNGDYDALSEAFSHLEEDSSHIASTLYIAFPDNSHISFLRSYLKRTNCKLENIIMPEPSGDYITKSIESLSKEYDAEFITAALKTVHFESFDITIYSDDDTYAFDACAVKIAYGENSYLFVTPESLSAPEFVRLVSDFDGSVILGSVRSEKYISDALQKYCKTKPDTLVLSDIIPTESKASVFFAKDLVTQIILLDK